MIWAISMRQLAAYILLFALAVLFVSLPLAMAFALPAPTLISAASAVPDTVVSGGPLFQIIEPYLVSGLGAAITALIAWAAALVQKWMGLKIDQAHRDALHSAAMTGVNMALSRLGTTANSLTIDTKSAVIAQAIAWIEKSVPGAMAHFKLTPDKLGAIVEAKIGALVAATPTPAVPLVFGPLPGGGPMVADHT